MNATGYTAPADIPPTVRATRLATAGHAQLVVRCPGCGQMHRHLGPSIRRGPCGSVYIVRAPRDTARKTA